MTFSAVMQALLWAVLLFTAICAIIGAIAFFVGGFIVYVADREFRKSRSRHGKKP